ncbi:MAG: Fic family protein [Candidatus Diapherotrites archaeon]|uniref:Fic family protein n=1 Tax=Candidatus Iainarchaeum sp. TaxID=3101447 RepID=A0A8T3YKJ2_9ARCH|nr:Fic family protein [Candidatus Diapherotrites archaeon]
MFLEVREVAGKKKYYLVHSFRQGKKVGKIRRYLGTNLSKEKLEELKRIAEMQIIQRMNAFKKINDPLLEVLSEEEIQKIKELQENSQFKIFHLSEDEWRRFSEIFTYNTNAIEGSELNQKEVREILEKGKWPQDKSKDDISEAYGVEEAIQAIRKTKEHVSIELIKKIHEIVFKNSKHYAGQLRPKGVEVVVSDGLGNIVHEGAPSEKVAELLKELAQWYNKSRKKYPPLLLAGVVHNQFENIHPFQDGNGRVGRILMNNILIKHGLPPVNIDLSKRKEYYKSLQEYEKNHDIRPTIELLLEEYKELKKQLR